MHIGAMLARLAHWHPDRVALIDPAGAWSYRQFLSRINRAGHALRGLGLSTGDRVALLVPDIREYLEAEYATMSAGFVRVPIDPRLTRPEIVAVMRHAGARALVSHSAFADRIDRLSADVEDLETIVVIGDPLDQAIPYEALLNASSDGPLGSGNADDLAALNFTGGTTSAPKAAMLRHENLAAAAQNIVSAFAIDGKAIFLNVRPLWPIAQIILLSYILAGATVVLGGRFDGTALAGLIRQTGATRTSLVPTQLVRFIEHIGPADDRLSSLQAIHVGGSRIPPAVFEQALALLGPRIGVLYGLTEAPVTCYLSPERLDTSVERRRRLINSAGRPLFGCDLTIGPPSARQGGGGEILIRGRHVMAGYWRDETRTQAALKDKWLHTGDLGELDASGDLYVVGRMKEMIRSGSSTVIPSEVEDVIASHPAVSEVSVLGLPDAEWGEIVVAFVVPRPGVSVAEAELIRHCRDRMAGYKAPRSIRFVSSLPRTHHGKVSRAELIGRQSTDVSPNGG